MEQDLVIYGIPLIVLAASAPMALGMVPPNRIYGFRTSETLSSPEVWYAANRAAGWFMIAAAAFSFAFNLALSSAFPEWTPDRLEPWLVAGNLVPLGGGLVASFLYARRL